MSPKYPIYIVSKGRWESRLTSKSLERMKVFYYIIVEEQEYEEYTNVIDKEKVLILPKEYQLNYDVFNDEIGKGNSTGPGAARNFAWDHSIGLGAKRHWVLDDNIYDFYRLNRNAKNIVQTGTIFKCAEDFVDRYTNILISGFNYCKFCLASEKYPPYLFNTRIYSTLLIDNAFLQEKATTQRIKGGNSKEFYDEEGTLNKSKMLQEMHPDLARVTWRFNRWHHFVDYKPFKRNKPIKVEGLVIPKGINNYGMKMINIKELENAKTH